MKTPMFVVRGFVQVVLAYTAMLATPALAQFNINMSDVPSSNAGAFISFPYIFVGNEFAAHFETNLDGLASLAVEYIYVPEGEELSEEERKEKNNSLISQGYEGLISVSRYSQPDRLAGFYWTLAGGYRVLECTWRFKPENSYALTGAEEVDDEQRLVYKLKSTGMTGHGRIGYRYLASSFPLSIGGFFGIRHYDGQFDDDGSESDKTPASDDEKTQVKRIFMTKPEMAIEVGLAF